MRPLWIILGGVGGGILAMLAVAALVAGGPESTSAEGVELTFPAVDHDDQAADDLVVVWNRWRTATFVSSGRWSRTLDGSESPLRGDVYIAQDLPRRLVVRLGAVTEQIDGDVTTCDAESDDLIMPACTAMSGGRSYDDRVAAEMTLVRQYVIGANRVYDVAAADDCFQLELITPVLRSPWGRAAEFCFDEASGALKSSRVRRQTAIDLEITSMIRMDVTDADF